MLFHEYYDDWINTYKDGIVRPVTFTKYKTALSHLKNLAPDITLDSLNSRTYQQILNRFGENHAKQTCIDFNNYLKAAIVDAVEDGLITSNPTRRCVFKDNPQQKRAEKFLDGECAARLIAQLDLPEYPNWDWLILIGITTGLRFAEALALAPNDFDFSIPSVSVDKTFDYKISNKLEERVKTGASKRTVLLDPKTAEQLESLTNDMPRDELLFVPAGERVFNSTVNARLKTLCRKAGVPVISFHSLRHTHASILLAAGVSIHSISRRLGHAKVSITQDVYTHIIRELEDKDNDKVGLAMQELLNT